MNSRERAVVESLTDEVKKLCARAGMRFCLLLELVDKPGVAVAVGGPAGLGAGEVQADGLAMCKEAVALMEGRPPNYVIADTVKPREKDDSMVARVARAGDDIGDICEREGLKYVLTVAPMEDPAPRPFVIFDRSTSAKTAVAVLELSARNLKAGDVDVVACPPGWKADESPAP